MSSFLQQVSQDWQSRPWWMNLIYYFCLYMTFIYMPFDIFIKPVAEDHEIWLGFSLTGWWAKATAPFHWMIYAAGAYGFAKKKAWMWPWAAVYAAQVVVAMVVWNLVNVRGGGWLAGVIAGAIFALPMIALWRARSFFQPDPLGDETPELLT